MSVSEVDEATRSEPPMGCANVRVAWWMIGASMAVGAVLGLWSFGGPLSPRPASGRSTTFPGAWSGWATSPRSHSPR